MGTEGMKYSLVSRNSIEVAVQGQAAHVDDREIRFEFSGTAANFPAVQLAKQINAGHESAIFVFGARQESDRLFAGRCDGNFKAAVAESFFYKTL